MSTKVRSVTFDFDSYDFWLGWETRDLLSIAQDESVRRYFETLARWVAGPFTSSWTARWLRQSGTGHAVYVDFTQPLSEVDQTEQGRILQAIKTELSHTTIDQDDWVVNLQVLVMRWYEDDTVFAVTNTKKPGRCIVTWHDDETDTVECYGWIEGERLFVPRLGDEKRDSDFVDGVPDPDAGWYDCESGALAIHGIPGSTLSIVL